MIRRGDNFHSRFVNWAKIVLPLVALGLMSTLFLLSKSVDVTDQLRLTDVDLTQRAHELGATNPSFAGVMSGGEAVSFHAASVRPDPDDPERLLAEAASATLLLNSGGVIDIVAQRGEANQSQMMARLEGEVRVTTTTGYDMNTDAITAQFDTLFAESEGPVSGIGPPGTLDAGRMILRSDPETGDITLRFTDGVKLIYRPAKAKD